MSPANLAEVREACARAMAAHPDEPRFAVDAGYVALATGDFAQAARLWRGVVASLDAPAQTWLGILLWFGPGGVPQDRAEASRLVRLAATTGLPMAQTAMVGMFGDCRVGTGCQGLEGSGPEAVERVRTAAAQGDARSQTTLGYLLWNGFAGLWNDVPEATRWFRMAAEQGDERAMEALSRLALLRGDLAEVDYWQRRAGTVDDAFRQITMARIYEIGRPGHPPNMAAAADLYRLAAARGDVAGQLALGRFYENGLGGVGRDTEQAVRYYRLAAAAGYAPAQMRLADVIENGYLGVPRDLEAAVLLYRTVAAQSGPSVDPRQGDLARSALRRLGRE